MHPSCLPIDHLLSECRWRFLKRSGPGGQHRNKVESAAVVEHVPTGIAAEANENRSQAANRTVALGRLRLRLALAVRTSPTESPGAVWQSHLKSGKIWVADNHVDLPAMLAETLDVLADCDWDLAVAARWCGASKTQLVRFLAQVPPALALVNQHRSEQGKPPLRT
jgi:hypothetical protein